MVKTLAEKFFIKSGHRVAVIHAPDRYMTDVLNDLPSDVSISHELAGQFDQIQCFVVSQNEVAENIARLKTHLKEGGVLWMTYPKGGPKANIKTDLHRDILNDAVSTFGFSANHMISIDDTWSSLRFKIAE
jgi:hypothetical protein